VTVYRTQNHAKSKTVKFQKHTFETSELGTTKLTNNEFEKSEHADIGCIHVQVEIADSIGAHFVAPRNAEGKDR
jgi:hypothetical protein